jgi:hypothetical protein
LFERRRHHFWRREPGYTHAREHVLALRAEVVLKFFVFSLVVLVVADGFIREAVRDMVNLGGQLIGQFTSTLRSVGARPLVAAKLALI